MLKFTRIAVIPLLLLLFFTVGASAEYTTNKAEFMLKYPGLTLQNFSESQVPGGTLVQCTAPLNSSSDDNCVTPGVILPELSFNDSVEDLGMAGPFFRENPNHSLVSERLGETFFINIEPGAASVVGLQIGCFAEQPECSGIVNVRSFGPDSIIVGSFDLEVSDRFDSFLGISREDGILSVHIAPDPDNPFSITTGVDAVYFGLAPRNVPTMSEWGLIATVAGLGIIGFIVINRRKRAFN